jgi:hypothetical protein
VSLSPEQRAQVLRLHHVEGVSADLIATMTGLSVSVVRKVVQEGRRQGVPAVDRAHPRRPSSKDRIECQIRAAREQCGGEGAGASCGAALGGRPPRLGPPRARHLLADGAPPASGRNAGPSVS